MEGKKWTFGNMNISGAIKVIKGISLDKWFLIGAAGLVLVLCSDSCQEDAGENDKNSNNTGNTSLFSVDDNLDIIFC